MLLLAQRMPVVPTVLRTVEGRAWHPFIRPGLRRLPSSLSGYAGSPGADHSGFALQTQLFGSVQEQTAEPELLGDSATAPVREDESG